MPEDFEIHSLDTDPSSEEEPIIIRLGDLKRPELTENQKKAKEMAAEARRHFSEMATNAQDELTYLKAHLGDRMYSIPSNIEWMFEYGDVTQESLYEDIDDERFVGMFTRDLKAIEKLREKLLNFPPKEGYARVGIKRSKDNTGHTDGYQVLAIFPEGTELVHSGLDQNIDRNGEQAIFYKPENACTMHACDDLYRSSPEGEERGLVYIPLKDLQQALSDLKMAGGISQYMLEKTEEGVKITQDAANYITIALLGGFGNETDRVRISDLWKRIN